MDILGWLALVGIFAFIATRVGRAIASSEQGSFVSENVRERLSRQQSDWYQRIQFDLGRDALEAVEREPEAAQRRVNANERTHGRARG